MCQTTAFCWHSNARCQPETGHSQLLEQFAARPETTGTVIRPVQAVTEDILNFFKCKNALVFTWAQGRFLHRFIACWQRFVRSQPRPPSLLLQLSQDIFGLLHMRSCMQSQILYADRRDKVRVVILATKSTRFLMQEFNCWTCVLAGALYCNGATLSVESAQVVLNNSNIC